MTKPLRILTFNHHESFLNAMAVLGHQFDVVTKKGDLDLAWNKAARQPPENFRLVDYADVQQDLRQGRYDYVICHTIKNLLWLFWINRCKTIFVAHIPLYWDTPKRSIKSLAKLLTYFFYKIFHPLEFIAVSEWKRATWGLDGPVARFFPVPFPVALLAEQKAPGVVAVTVGNGIKSRGAELGWDLLEGLTREFPIRILGRNPDLSSATVPRDYAEFVRLFSAAHFYVYTIRQPEGDGYNTAMLEAMQLGMPVVTIANPSSPIINGINGLVAQDSQELRRHMRRMLLDPELVKKMGTAARQTVASEFSEHAFSQTWRDFLSSP